MDWEVASVSHIGAPPAFAAVIYRGQSLAAMERAGAVTVDHAMVERFVILLLLPLKAGFPTSPGGDTRA